MKWQDIWIIGFMLFAMFFGARSLIFPVSLGFESGAHYQTAMIGFMITGIGLPLMTMVAGSLSTKGYPGLLKQVNPIFFRNISRYRLYYAWSFFNNSSHGDDIL